ncbi:RHS repeat protein, partial [Elizabethkingia argentiflava]
MDITGKAITSPAPRRGFGELFGSAKDKLDHLQKNMASILPSMPGQNVAKYYDLAIGVDFHATVIPPMPLLPVPHIGMVFDIMSAVMSAISTVVPPPPPADGTSAPTSLSSICKAIVHSMKPTVKVHGQWIANAGTGIQHLPGIFAHLPFPVVTPMASSEMFMGSSTVLADGGPCSTQFHPALSCNLVGIPAPLRIGKPKPKVALMAPTSMLLIITSGGSPVLVGGAPTIDLFQMGFRIGLKGMGKLWKKASGGLKKVINKIKTKNPKLSKILQPVKCRLFGEPVDAATGRVYSSNTDIELPGPLPFVWQRTYYSDAQAEGALGYNWHHSYHMGLYDMGDGYASLRLSDGREILVPLVENGHTYYHRIEKLTFTRDENGYLLIDADKLHYRFKGGKNSQGYHMLSQISTAEGFRIKFEYNHKGCLTKITDSRNQLIHVNTDPRGYITRLYTDTESRSIVLVEYAYDDKGNMVYVKDVGGAEKHFHYKGHLLVQLTNQTGQSFYWEYQGIGDEAKCIHTWGDGGVLEYWTQYLPGHTITRNGLGHTSHYFYDENHLIYKIIDENQGITHQSYNQYQELEVVVDPEGLSQKYQYNRFGMLRKLENENGEITTYEYDEEQNLTALSTPGGKQLKWEYDALNRVTRKTMADGNTLSYAYDNMYLKSITDGQGNAFYLFFDQRHQLVQLTYPNESFSQWGYDAMGNVLYERDVRGNYTRYAYDDAGNVTYISEPDGNEHYFQYDSSYNIISAKDDLHEVVFKYGSLGVLLSRTQNGRSVRFGYDRELRLKSISNEAAEVYGFELDGLGNVVGERGFDGQYRRYERDANSRVTQVLRPGDKWSRYQYDGLGNVVLEEHSDQSWAAYKYDKDGMLADALNQDIHIKLLRNRGGHVVKEVQGAHSLSRSYDKWGHVVKIESSMGADIAMDYDQLGQVRQMHSKGWNAQWQYDKSGLEIQRQLSGNVEIKTQRDRYGRVITRSIGAHHAEQVRHSYHWGKGNRLNQIVNELSRATTRFEYDAWDQLVSGTYSHRSGSETIYKAPDAIGNLFKTPERKDRQYDKGGKLLKDEKYYYHYDGEGNLIFKELISSAYPAIYHKKELQKKLGIQLRGSGTGWIYEWAGNGMLQSLIQPHGKRISFVYDALGRRIAKEYKGRVTRWLWDGNVPLHEWQYEGSF